MSLFGTFDIKAIIDALEHSPAFLAWLNSNIQPTGNPIVLNGPVVGPSGGPVDFVAGIQTPALELIPSFAPIDTVPGHSIYYLAGDPLPRWNSSASPALASTGIPLGGATGNTVITSTGGTISVTPIIGIGYDIDVNPAAPSTTSITAGPGIAVAGNGSSGTPYIVSATGGTGTVTSVTSSNSGIIIGGTATDPTVGIVPGSLLLPEVVAGTNITSVIKSFSGIDGHAIYTVNAPARVISVAAGNSGIAIAGTATNPTISLVPGSPLLPEVVAGTNVTSIVKTFGGDGHAIYTVNIPAPGTGTVTSVTSGNSGIVVGGTATNPTISLAPASPLLPEVVAGTNVTSVVQTFDGIDGHAIYTVNIPPAGTGTVTSVSSGNSAIAIGGTATDPTISLVPGSPLLPEVVAGTNVTSVVQTFDGIDGHAIYTVNIPAPGTVMSLTSGNSAIVIGGTAANPTVSIVPGSPLLPEVVAGTNVTSVVQTFDGIDGHAIYTVNIPAAGLGTVTSVTSGNSAISIGGTATDPTVSLVPNSPLLPEVVAGTNVTSVVQTFDGIDGHAIYTVNIPAPGTGTVTSVSSGNSAIAIGGTPTDPTISLVPGSPLLPEVVAGTNVISVVQTFDGIDGHAIYTVNIPAAGLGTVTSVTSGNSGIVVGGTATDPTISLAPGSPLLPEVVAGTNVTSVVQTFDGIDGHAIYTVNIPAPGTVNSVTSGNSAIAVGGTATDPTVSLVPGSPLLPEVVAGTNVTSVVQTFDGIDGHAIYTVNIPAAGTGTVTSVTSGNSGIVIGGTATDPTVSLAPASPLLPEVVAGANVTSVVQTFDGIDGHAIYTVNIPAAGTGTVTSVTSGNSAIVIGGTATDPTVALAPASPLLPEVVAGTNVTSVIQTFDGIDGHAIYTVNIPAPGTGTVTSVTSGNSAISIGGTATDPTVLLVPNSPLLPAVVAGTNITSVVQTFDGIDGHAIYTVNAPARVASVTAGNAAIIIGGTATAPTVALDPASTLLPEVVAGTNITSVVKTFDGGNGHAIYTVNAPARVASVTAGNASITIGGTATAPTVAVASNFVTTAALSGILVTGGPVGPFTLALDGPNAPTTLRYWTMGTSVVAGRELSSWTPVNAATDADIALLPKGAGGISQRNYATSGNVGGLALGIGAVDLQATSAASNVGYATGANSGVFAGLQGIVTGASSVILGGGTATVGQGNTVNAAQSAIVAGIQGVINIGSINSVIGGGAGNVIGDAGAGSNVRSVVIGGTLNSIQNGTASGTDNIIAASTSSSIGLTASNFVGTNCGIIAANFGQITGASARSVVLGGGSTVIGGANIITAGLAAAIVGGNANTATGSNSTVLGGLNNAVSGTNTSCVAGSGNTASGTQSACFAGTGNTASSVNSCTVGGSTITATALHAVAIGGTTNTAGAQSSVALGGATNVIPSGANNAAMIGGSGGNMSSGSDNSCIGGGSSNTLDGPTGFIAAGTTNSIAVAVSNGFIGGGTGQTALGANGVKNVASIGGSHTTNSASNSIMTGAFGSSKSCAALEDGNKIQIAGGSVTNQELITVLGRNNAGQGAIVTSALHSTQHSSSSIYMEWNNESLSAVGLARGGLADRNVKKVLLGYMVSIDEQGFIGKADSFDDVVGVSVSGEHGLVGGGYDLHHKDKYQRDELGNAITRASYIEGMCDLVSHTKYGCLRVDQKELAQLQFATPKEICAHFSNRLDPKHVKEILAMHHQPRQVTLLDKRFDANLPYTSRAGRAEWTAVAHAGSVIVRDDGSCTVGRRCVPKDGVATHSSSKEGYRVVSRVTKNTVAILL